MGEDAIAAIMFLVGFLGGVVVGIIVTVSVASRREDSLCTLDGEAPDAVCRGARRLTGMGALGSGFEPVGNWREPAPDPRREEPGQ